MNTKSSKLNSYMRLLSYLKPYWKLLLVSVFFMLLVSGSNLVVPWIIKDVIDKVLNDKDLEMLYLIIVAILVTFLIARSPPLGTATSWDTSGRLSSGIFEIRCIIICRNYRSPTMIAAAPGTS